MSQQDLELIEWEEEEDGSIEKSLGGLGGLRPPRRELEETYEDFVYLELELPERAPENAEVNRSTAARSPSGPPR